MCMHGLISGDVKPLSAGADLFLRSKTEIADKCWCLSLLAIWLSLHIMAWAESKRVRKTELASFELFSSVPRPRGSLSEGEAALRDGVRPLGSWYRWGKA